MIAFWPSIYNLNFSLPTNVRGYEKGTAEEFKKQASSVCIWIKKYLSWTNSPAKYEKAGWYALPFQQIPLFRCFCNNFFLVISDTQTSEQYPWLWKMSILELYILKIAFNVNGFTSHFTTISAKDWVVENSSYISSTWILQIPGCDVFREKHPSAIVNIFCKSYSSITHKCWICLSHTWVLLKFLAQNKLNCCFFIFFCNSYFLYS